MGAKDLEEGLEYWFIMSPSLHQQLSCKYVGSHAAPPTRDLRTFRWMFANMWQQEVRVDDGNKTDPTIASGVCAPKCPW